ncbi:EAL domain-containing protein [Thiohalocapsa marina]|uniref:EAL domain-containing protein n=1 Tax=Thiohalocapsa marina TaxID=424902 RepID=A0A5M8FES4_9GAMM|nr:EAL domain-containing protein [Thiohalocapsa marina]
MMAHGLGVEVIAEGVETLAQARILAEMECDHAQGFYYSKPVPPKVFEALLQVRFTEVVPPRLLQAETAKAESLFF